jgi:CRISPR type III-A-associated protein Csm2
MSEIDQKIETDSPAPEASPEPAPEAVPPPEPAPEPPAVSEESQAAEAPKPRPEAGPRPERRPPTDRPTGDRPTGDRGPRPQGQGQGPRRDDGPRRGDDRGPRGDDRGRDNRGRDDRGPGGRGPAGRPTDLPLDIEIEKLIADPLYLDNQAHAVVARMRDMDSGTRSQLRRFYNAVRRACRTQDAERQHEFVMLRARLAYTIARHSLRSLDPLEKLLLQVTRKNDLRGYERFRDLFEAIIAYNE